MRRRKQTVIDGQPVWFLVCAIDELHGRYLGPFRSLEDAQGEVGRALGLRTCEYSHFTASWAPPWAEVVQGPSLAYYDYCGSLDSYRWATSRLMDDWVERHNGGAIRHPMHRSWKSCRPSELESHWNGLLA